MLSIIDAPRGLRFCHFAEPQRKTTRSTSICSIVFRGRKQATEWTNHKTPRAFKNKAAKVITRKHMVYPMAPDPELGLAVFGAFWKPESEVLPQKAASYKGSYFSSSGQVGAAGAGVGAVCVLQCVCVCVLARVPFGAQGCWRRSQDLLCYSGVFSAFLEKRQRVLLVAGQGYASEPHRVLLLVFVRVLFGVGQALVKVCAPSRCGGSCRGDVLKVWWQFGGWGCGSSKTRTNSAFNSDKTSEETQKQSLQLAPHLSWRLSQELRFLSFFGQCPLRPSGPSGALACRARWARWARERRAAASRLFCVCFDFFVLSPTNPSERNSKQLRNNSEQTHKELNS